MTRTEIQTLHDELRDLVTGPVLRGDDPAAAEEAAGFQLALRHRPDVVVGATSAADMVAAVRAAAARELPVTVHATGHGLREPARGGVLVTTARLDRVEIDPTARTARLGAGARWGAVLAAAAPHGLMPPSGSFPGVGAAGYVFGGGIGLLARADGWASDHVRSFELVDPDGTPREVTATTDPEAFARLRGTGPRPGEVVTALTVGLLPEGELTGGNLLLDLGASDTPGDPAPLHAFAAWTAGLPEEITATLSVINFPEWDELPPFLRGRRTARIAVAVRAGAQRSAELLEPLRTALPGAPVQDSVGPLRATESARVHAEPDAPHGYTGENLLLDALPAAGLDALARLDGPMTVVNIRHLGGALARPPAVADSVPARDAAYLVHALCPVEESDDPAATPVRRVLDDFAAAAVGVSRSFGYGPRA